MGDGAGPTVEGETGGIWAGNALGGLGGGLAPEGPFGVEVRGTSCWIAEGWGSVEGGGGGGRGGGGLFVWGSTELGRATDGGTGFLGLAYTGGSREKCSCITSISDRRLHPSLFRRQLSRYSNEHSPLGSTFLLALTSISLVGTTYTSGGDLGYSRGSQMAIGIL